MRRVILHSDMNCFYASVEMLFHPEWRERPMAVGGDEEARHGIILAKNEPAKRYGVQTGEPLWQARSKCPDLIISPAHFDRYWKYARLARELYLEYTDQVEPFGLDEAWLDVTASRVLFGGGMDIAEAIRGRVERELGLTVSVGVSFNKVFAKLGSDYKKPNAVTEFSAENFRERVWPLPVSSLLFVGRATTKKLAKFGVHTIGDLANMPVETLQYELGKNGLSLWASANGMDTSPVARFGEQPPVKSVGNSQTTPRDLICEDDVRVVFWGLCESVAMRLREKGLLARTVTISLRDNELVSITRQMALTRPTNLAAELHRAAMALFRRHYSFGRPLRSIGVQGSELVTLEDAAFQLDLTGEEARRVKLETLEKSMFSLRSRYGNLTVRRGAQLLDRALGGLDPKEEHTIYPASRVI